MFATASSAGSFEPLLRKAGRGELVIICANRTLEFTQSGLINSAQFDFRLVIYVDFHIDLQNLYSISIK